jgi:hypothetical protein
MSLLHHNRLTFRCVVDVVAKKSTQIESLSFKSCSVDANALKRLGAVTGLQLRKLDVADCSGINQEAVLEFSRNQPKLELLNIDFCRRILVRTLI